MPEPYKATLEEMLTAEALHVAACRPDLLPVFAGDGAEDSGRRSDASPRGQNKLSVFPSAPTGFATRYMSCRAPWSRTAEIAAVVVPV